jgi:hypothetical protein
VDFVEITRDFSPGAGLGSLPSSNPKIVYSQTVSSRVSSQVWTSAQADFLKQTQLSREPDLMEGGEKAKYGNLTYGKS